MEDNSVISIKSSSSSTASKTSNAAYNEAHPGLIPNDTMLALSITALLIFLLYEIYSNRGSRRKKDHESNASSQSQVVPSSRRHVPLPQPVFQGVVQLTPTIMDATALSRYIPNKIPVYKLPIEEEETKPSDEAKQDANATTETVLIGLPQIPGCELNSVAVDRLLKDFPLMSRSDLVRFLVARKGNIEAATEMIRKANSWHMKYLPLRSSPDILKAIGTKCIFPHGVDRDGAPVIYMRGCLYDSTKASSDIYVSAAAHTIDWALRRTRHCALTVLVHTSSVPGGPNEGADVNFIKGFVQTLSDNFPERLKRLAIYPFPWYGRALWSVVRMFVDKRTQDKVLLVPGKGLPPEITAIVDASQIPECCGGLDRRPIVDIEATLLPPLEPSPEDIDSNEPSSATEVIQE